MYWKSANEVWVNLNQSHEGDNRVRKENHQTLKMSFEILKIHREESVEEYFLRIDEVTNMIRGVCEVLKKYIIVQKVLRSLRTIFNAKIYDIKNMSHL